MATTTNVDSMPDLGGEASAGFQSVVHAGQRPYTRPNRRSAAVEGGGFQTAVKRDDERSPVAGNSWQKVEAAND
jgi:hypothetical protein